MKWTEAQKSAIQKTGANVLVSAAAGSGKTTVLAERCCHLICDAAQPVNIGQLLVVTYTDAAAEEMKARIENALRERLAADAGNERLQMQAALVQQAQISTIHSFCRHLIRQHFHRLGIDPAFVQLDEEESLLLRWEVVQQLFIDRYESEESGHSDAFRRLADDYGQGNDARLMRLITSTHARLQSLVDPPQWMNRALARLNEAASNDLADSELGRAWLKMLDDEFASIDAQCDAAIRSIDPAGFPKYIDHIESLQSMARSCRKHLKSGQFEQLATQMRDTTLPRRPNYSKVLPGRDQACGMIEAISDRLKNGTLLAGLRFTESELRQGVKSTASHAKTFLDLVEEFGLRYQEAKSQRRALDFSDLERFALNLLRDQTSENCKPSPVANACQRLYEHVLVDEYQDINEIQDAILTLVSRGADGKPNSGGQSPNCFCVGDVKQSIYRFRLSEPARFLEREREYRNEKSARGMVIDLQANYRSRHPLLESLNAVFERLMVGPGVEITYDASHRLHPGATYPEADESIQFAGSPIELHLVEPRSTGREEVTEEPAGASDAPSPLENSRVAREATVAARRILNLLGRDGSKPMNVADRGADGNPTLRVIEPRDIVLLLRSPSSQAEHYVGVLRRHGIASHASRSGSFFESTEVRDMLALLSLLRNQQQDIPLAAVMRSPLMQLDGAEDAMARVRIAYPAQHDGQFTAFHEAIRQYAWERDDETARTLNAMLRRIARWRVVAQRQPVADLIRHIFDQTGYETYVSGLPDGSVRSANLQALHDRARAFSGFASQGLDRFLDYLDRLREEADASQASDAAAADNVVRIMSVHGAKGLEFPVVLIADMARRFNVSDLNHPILVDRASGIGLEVVDEALQVRYPSLASMLIKEQLRRQTVAEELRVLYVAATRAREQLILIGAASADDVQEWRMLWKPRKGALPLSEILSAKHMLDWIGPVAVMLEGGDAPDFEITLHATDDLMSADLPEVESADSPRGDLFHLRPMKPAPPPHPLAHRIIANLTTEYVYKRFTEMQAAFSVTAHSKGKGDDSAAMVANVAALGHAAEAANSGATAEPDGAAPLNADLPLDSPRFLQDASLLSPTDIGTAVHMALQYLDFSRPCAGKDLQQQLDAFVRGKLMSPAQAAAVDRDGIDWLLHQSELADVFRRHAATLRREQPFTFAMPPAEYESPSAAVPRSADPLDRVMLRGRIDVMFREPAGWSIIDYKTDRVTGSWLDQRIALYRGQVKDYQNAIGAITGEAVARVYLVFLFPRRVVSIASDD